MNAFMAPADRGQGPFAAGRLLLTTPGDTTPGQVVRGHLNCHLIAGQDADEVHAQLAGDVSQDDVAVADVHVERGVGQGLGHNAFQLDHIVFCQSNFLP